MERRFGVEIEIAGIAQERVERVLTLVGITVTREAYNHTARSHWKIVSDSSVRDGFEVVSPVLEGEAGIEELRTVITALDDAGATINKTCGLHIHFDASGFTSDHLKNLVLRYAMFEAEIDAFMPPSRRGASNHYCNTLADLVASPSFRQATTISGLVAAQGSRYYKVNLQSYQRHGTVEFRQHSGTVNAPKAINWVRFLDAFVEASASELLEAIQPARLTGSQRLLWELIQAGSTVAEIQAATGWQPHTLRAAVTRLRQAGVRIELTRQGTEKRYRAIPTAGAADDHVYRGVDPAVERFYRNRAAVLAA
ncbi:hypothetical protein JCM15519_38860 [Fundidesulfovibrio butyratiphilus]